jgi:phospholipase/carboxylesterase
MDEPYTKAIRSLEETLLRFLRRFEKLQEEIHLAQITEAQQRLQEAAVDVFPQVLSDLAALTPPESQRMLHAKLSEAVTHLAESYQVFLSGKGRQFAEAFLQSRNLLCRGLYLLYDLRRDLPGLQEYWVLPEAMALLSEKEAQAAQSDIPVGFRHNPRAQTRGEYSLYVPEYYSATQSWPLIVCLHGGYGRGDEYIWTWLRPAKSRGYLLLAPKSIGPTWSVLNPPLDTNSIRAMLEEVSAAYNIDRKRVYLSGLSDGGMFAYLLGLSCPEWFAGIAPIAGELSPMTDPLLRRKQGIEAPLFVVHGAKDFIFDVRSVRASCELLKKIGYNITYTELPEWGHAYTYSINEQLVLPWFEGLPRGA